MNQTPDNERLASDFSLDDTRALVRSALIEASEDKFWWKIKEDRDAAVIHATMEFRKTAQLKRKILLSIRFITDRDGAVFVEYFYEITPPFNRDDSVEVLVRTREAISNAITSRESASCAGQKSSKDDPLMGEARRLEAEAETGMLRGIEIVLAVNAAVLGTLAVLRGGFDIPLPLVAGAQLLWVPVGLMVMIFLPTQSGKRASGVMMKWGLLVFGGITGCCIALLAVPIILLGLCIGSSCMAR